MLLQSPFIFGTLFTRIFFSSNLGRLIDLFGQHSRQNVFSNNFLFSLTKESSVFKNTCGRSPAFYYRKGDHNRHKPVKATPLLTRKKKKSPKQPKLMSVTLGLDIVCYGHILLALHLYIPTNEPFFRRFSIIDSKSITFIYLESLF